MQIDWLVFSDSSLFVIEVGVQDAEEADEEKGTESLILKTFNQIAKDQTVIDQLLQVSGVNQLNVFYLVVYPNLPFTTIGSRMKRVKEHITFLNDLVGPKTSRLELFKLCLSSTLHEEYSSIIKRNAKSYSVFEIHCVFI